MREHGKRALNEQDLYVDSGDIRRQPISINASKTNRSGTLSCQPKSTGVVKPSQIPCKGLIRTLQGHYKLLSRSASLAQLYLHTLTYTYLYLFTLNQV
jgi:hypothetical protein